MSETLLSGETPIAAQEGEWNIYSRQTEGGIHVKFSEVDWNALVHAGGFLDKEEVELLKVSDEAPIDSVLHDAEKARKYVGVLVKIMMNITSDSKAQHYAISRVDDVVAEDPVQHCRLFCKEEDNTLDQTPFMRVIDSGDAAAKQVASVVLALLIVGGDGSNSQLLYELCFSLWSMSLCESAKQDFMTAGAVPTLVQQVACAQREKIVRVSLAALRNLTEGQVDGFNAEMISCGLPKTLDNMKNRKWADPDVAEDADVLQKCLQRNYRDLSTMERYSQEVMSGQLKWGVVHTEKFWRENNRAVEADEFFILKQLIDLLKSEDEKVVSIACYDLGEFVRFYPSGKAIVRHLGAKEKVMNLLGSKHQEVQREALQCISKIMVNKWEFVR